LLARGAARAAHRRGDDPGALYDHLAFGEWFYRHSLDPTHRPDVIRNASATSMNWER
jgi:hypothetical protein